MGRMGCLGVGKYPCRQYLYPLFNDVIVFQLRKYPCFQYAFLTRSCSLDTKKAHVMSLYCNGLRIRLKIVLVLVLRLPDCVGLLVVP